MIECKLRCKCTDGEVTLRVRDRKKEEDIRDYMEHIQEEIGFWHMSRGCPETNLEYLKIPVPNETKGIGFSV